MLLLIIIASFFHTVPPGSEHARRQWLVSARSKLEISGNTIINRFHCKSTNYAGSDTLTEFVDHRTGSSVLIGSVTMMISNFDCRNEMITRDFKETLKADGYPRLDIRFIELRKTHVDNGDLHGAVEITLAGISKKYPITCVSKSAPPNEQHLEGMRPFKFSDFGLQPPNKFFGLLKAEDNVSVIFHLRLTSVIAENSDND
ncbi:MAG TPA: YceI family protein [Cyclobacteriaceae bacterium]|nr:YceI family protein [Cyclobacteriaceae bacterium]HRJ80942.1 YceI family protein [Cyclobacteriaceae bacterium]